MFVREATVTDSVLSEKKKFGLPAIGVKNGLYNFEIVVIRFKLNSHD